MVSQVLPSARKGLCLCPLSLRSVASVISTPSLQHRPFAGGQTGALLLLVLTTGPAQPTWSLFQERLHFSFTSRLIHDRWLGGAVPSPQPG